MRSRGNPSLARRPGASRADTDPDLPDRLVLKDGWKVTTADMWWQRRRPEIVEEFVVADEANGLLSRPAREPWDL